ncbi:MAG TPA: anti-sigma factor antagonist [Thermoanaerobaculia bacterium]|nr:anti-sigma factor antagonist [Thermoanaerobaculia bacterium]
MPEENRFHLSIGSRFENIELVQVVLRDALLRLGMDEDARHWVDIAVREAVANAIKHGNEQNPAKTVQVDLAVEGEELVIRVADEGAGFDPDGVHDPLAPENLLRPNGRGIFYMRSFMDNIHYGSAPGGGTLVTLRKRLAGPKADPSQAEEEGHRMNVNVRQSGDVKILDLKGKITIGSGEVALRNAVQGVLDSGAQKVLINMRDVSTIDSSGIGELVSAYTTATNRGGKLKLVNLPAKVTDILTITQLITVFDVYDNEEEAIRSF